MNFTQKSPGKAVSNCGCYTITFGNTTHGKTWFNSWLNHDTPNRKHLYGGWDRDAAKQACIDHVAKFFPTITPTEEPTHV